MKQFLLSCVAAFFVIITHAQVTRINNNNSLNFNTPLSNTKQIFVSGTDQTLWVTDGTLAGTFQLSPVIKFVEDLGSLAFLNGKYIFSGTTPTTGAEVYITDGTVAGTVLVKDINTGASSSNPQNVGFLNGFIYFTAETPAFGQELYRTDGTLGGTNLVKDINPGTPGSSIDDDVAYLGGYLFFTAETAIEGRELWKTNGTTTTIVKDIVPGPGGSNYPNNYELTSTSNYLLFDARTPSSGVELWVSDGTDGGTVLLKDINAGPDSSNARSFSIVNNIVIFEATDATHGDELWRTDGTAGGTTILKDINPGTDSSTKINIELFPGFGFSYPVFSGFHIFNNKAYFVAYDGSSAGEVWSTDGTTANTFLVKDIISSATYPLPLIFLQDAINFPNKFIFPVSDLAGRSELWSSDGTPGGTALFKGFSPTTPGSPFIFLPFAVTNGNFTQPLFQGNKFFFSAGTSTEGTELWISDGVDGTATHTHIVKDINPGANDSDPVTGSSYLYTTTEFFFGATNSTIGLELWRTDGTTANTNAVQDINLGPDDADPFLDFFILNGKILFEATDGDNATETDLFVVNGSFSPLPIQLKGFTVTAAGNDALLKWNTSQEINSKDFTIQRSFDAQKFEDIGVVQAAGTSSNRHDYTFTDIGIINSGKTVVYYRLVSGDKDGKRQNYNIISLRLKGSNDWNVHLLSNPVRNNLGVLLEGVTGKLQLSVKDINGRTVYTNSFQNANGLLTLDVNLQRGTYLLVAENTTAKKVIKFIK